jgi:pimeloyl-ACP methyl ester carboxylesterase
VKCVSGGRPHKKDLVLHVHPTAYRYDGDASPQAGHTFNLIGVSFGGMVAQEVAVTAPERIQRLVLMCTSSGGMGGSSYPLHELAQLEPEQQAALSAQVKDTRFTPEWLMAGPRPSPTRSFAPPSPVGPLSRGRSSRPVPAATVARTRKGPASS